MPRRPWDSSSSSDDGSDGGGSGMDLGQQESDLNEEQEELVAAALLAGIGDAGRGGGRRLRSNSTQLRPLRGARRERSAAARSGVDGGAGAVGRAGARARAAVGRDSSSSSLPERSDVDDDALPLGGGAVSDGDEEVLGMQVRWGDSSGCCVAC